MAAFAANLAPYGAHALAISCGIVALLFIGFAIEHRAHVRASHHFGRG